jgi:hypothetical protein
LFATLDLTWKPSTSAPTPPAGKAPAIVRNDTYSHTIRITDGVLNGYDDWTFIAQIRESRLTGSTAAAALASFTVTEEADGGDLLIHLLLPTATTTTLDLPNGGYWDLQLSLSGVITTWLAGRVKVLDDVSRS